MAAPGIRRKFFVSFCGKIGMTRKLLMRETKPRARILQWWSELGGKLERRWWWVVVAPGIPAIDRTGIWVGFVEGEKWRRMAVVS